MEAGDDGADQAIVDAIYFAVRAGLYRGLARNRPQSAGAWNALAKPHSDRAATLLNNAITRLCVDDAGPDARGEDS